jgi:CRP-like cAMP-binding protein
LEAIQGISLFSGFQKGELAELFGTSKYQIQEYEKDRIIYLQNEVCKTVDIILNGQVSVQNIVENGNILTIRVFSVSDLLGANIMFSSRNHYPMMVVAATRTTILHMQREFILKLCQSSICFTVGLLATIADKTIVLADKINAISLKTIRQSLIDFMKYECHMQNSSVIVLDISKKDLAERLGIQRSSLSRELNKMRKDGLLEYDAWSITLKNLDAGKGSSGAKS